MNVISKIAVATALIGMAGLADHGTLRAEEAPALVTLKPMVGAAAAVEHQQFLLNARVGTKQTLSYFLNDNGLCKVTVMVADAFNGEDVPDTPAVRFEVAIDAGDTARMDTAEGKSLEFTCEGRAEQLIVKAGTQKST